MIVNYRFADGETSEVEVSDEIGAFIIESRREEAAADKKANRHCWSIDALTYEGLDYAVFDSPLADLDEEEEIRLVNRIRESFQLLTTKQRRRLELYVQGKTFREIAAAENVAVNAVELSIAQSIKKIKIYCSKHPVQKP